MCVNELEQSTTNLSFTYYLKQKILTLKKLDSSLENLLLLLDLVQILIQRATLLLSTRCDLDAQTLESTRASFKT